jgi:hypothetical protein
VVPSAKHQRSPTGRPELINGQIKEANIKQISDLPQEDQ